MTAWTMPPLKKTPQRLVWGCGEMLSQCHLGSGGIRRRLRLSALVKEFNLNKMLLALLAMALLPCANAQVSTGTDFAVAPGLLITNPVVIRLASSSRDAHDVSNGMAGFRLAKTLHTQSLTSNAIPSIAAPPLKIAFAYVGPIGDGGWTYAHELGRKAIEKEFGDKVKISFTENVPESADAERVFRDMASQGNKLIFGTTFGYMEPML